MGKVIRWPEDQEKRLRALAADGYSYGMATVMLNDEFRLSLSRSSVIGKAYRLGIQLSGAPAKSRRTGPPRRLTDEQRRQHREETVKRYLASRGTAAVAQAAAPKPARSAPEQSHAGKFTLEEIQTNHGCRWPFGHTPNMTFCGKPRDLRDRAGNYCTEHMRRATGGHVSYEAH